MSDNRMTPEWVVENFLPDYDEKRRKVISKIKSGKPIYMHDWINDVFPEALEHLLKAQRESCKHNYVVNVSHDDLDGSVIDLILSAPIPEPIKE